ncbi:MAG: nicotinamide-nucleotide amidohydrolase family protein [Leptospirillia bacterium]
MTGTAVEIVLTGEELVTGKLTDSNGRYLAGKLAALGLPCGRVTMVGDDPAAITRTIADALKRSHLVITSGGLGPTGDDLTRAAVAEATGRPLQAPPEGGGKPAYPMPEGGVPIHNPKGSAAGLWITLPEGRCLAALPGVPWEFEGMWPDLGKHVQTAFPEAVRHGITLRTAGLMEREVERRASAALADIPGCGVGVTANPLLVDLHLHAADPSTLARATQAVRDALGDVIYTTGDASLAQVVGDTLRERGLKLATAESCSGGAICAALVREPGASDYVEGAIVSYANTAKKTLLGVPEHMLETQGAVSEPVARAMAEGLLTRTQADIALAVTGIAGPGGGTPEKPVGMVFMAIADRAATFCRAFHHPGDRERVILRTVHRGIDLIRHYLHGDIADLERRFPAESPDGKR